MKTIITFLLSLTPIVTVLSQPVSFEHSATEENTTNNRTVIDNDAINDDATAIIVVKKIRKIVDGDVKKNPHEIQIGYDEMTGRHYIQNRDATKAMPEGSCYKVVVITSSGTNAAEQVTVEEDNFPFPNTIEVASTNFSAISILIASQLFNPVLNYKGETPFFLGYDYLGNDNWNIITTTSNSFQLDAKFNLIDASDYFIGIHTSSPENIDGYVNSVDDFANWTELDFEAINNNPDAGVFAQLVLLTGETIYSFLVELSSFYNSETGHWEIHTELENYISDFSFPFGYSFMIFATNPTLSTNENILSGNSVVFPNPVSNSINVKAQKPISEITLFNMLGQEFITINTNGVQHKQIDMSSHASGSYLVRIKSKDRIETIRIIKN